MAEFLETDTEGGSRMLMIPVARPTNTTITAKKKEKGSHFSFSIWIPPQNPCHVGRLMLLAQGTSHEHGRSPASARKHTCEPLLACVIERKDPRSNSSNNQQPLAAVYLPDVPVKSSREGGGGGGRRCQPHV